MIENYFVVQTFQAGEPTEIMFQPIEKILALDHTLTDEFHQPIVTTAFLGYECGWCTGEVDGEEMEMLVITSYKVLTVFPKDIISKVDRPF